METFIELLSSTSVTLTIAAILIIAFAKAIIKIFRMGVMYKADLASRKDLTEFEAEVRNDMRNYASQIQKAVTDSMMVLINERLKDIEDAKDAVETMKIMKVEMDSQIKIMLEKYEETRTISQEFRTMSNKIARLEYNDENKNERRSE